MGVSGKERIKVTAQVRPAVGGVAEAFYTASGRDVKIKNITIANTTAIDATATVYLDTLATTYDASTALYYQILVPANSTIIDPTERDIPMGTALQAECGTNLAITFTLNGIAEVI